MARIENENIALDWGEELVAPEEHANVILEEGTYAFDVIEFTRGRFPGSDKLCACPQAEVLLLLHGSNGNTPTVKERFQLNSKMLWKLVPFLKSIGLVDETLKNGEKFTVDWNGVEGSHGVCYVEPGSFTGSDGNEVPVNRVTRYLSRLEAYQNHFC